MGHFELFTCDDLPVFITKSRALADKLPEHEKSLILIERGAQLLLEQPTENSTQTTLLPADESNTVYFPRLIPLASLKKENAVITDTKN